MTVRDLDALEKLADEALPYWGAIDMALGGNPIAADIVAPFAASVSPATIKALIAELKEARGLMRKWSKMIDEPDVQKCGLASSLLFGIQKAARAFLARNGKTDLQKMQNNTPRNAPRGLSDEC